MMSKVIITVGVSASGKTTWAKEQTGYIITNRDDLRMSIWGVDENRHLPYGKSGQRFLESLVTKIQYLTIEEAIKNNRNIIVADTNLNKKYRQQLIEFCKNLGATVEIKVFDITFEEAYKRSAARKNGVTHDVLVKQFKQFDESFGIYKQTDFSSNKESAIIVDIDGTLAHMVNRTPFEFNKVCDDAWDEDVLKIEEILENPQKFNIPNWMLNRREDYETGENIHLIESDLDMTLRDDLNRMKKTRSYKGRRHEAGLPVRGQRTKSTFRNSSSVGVKRS